MTRDCKHISMTGSNKLSWDDIDKYANSHGFKETSSFIQYLCEKEILGFKTKAKDVILYVQILLIFCVILILLIVR